MTPFVCGHGPWLLTMADRVASALGEQPIVIDVLQPHAVGFFRRLLAGNAQSFGGMAMPAWVQLDCATLPSVVVGFARRRKDVPELMWSGLSTWLQQQAPTPHDDSDSDDAWVPMAQYCALPTPQPSLWVGFSLYSLVPGYGLRSKALALLAYGAQQQRGVTQIDNSALKTHTRLGPLHIDAVEVQVHCRPAATIVYTLQVPKASVLTAFARGELNQAVVAGNTRRMPLTELAVGHLLVGVDANSGLVSCDEQQTT
jgi:hypothetical protein